MNIDNPLDIPKAEPLSLETLLEVERFEPINDLYTLGTNYEPALNPFSFFLDIIGWSEAEYGSPLIDHKRLHLDYNQIWHLGEALSCVGDFGLDAYAHAGAVMQAEMQELNGQDNA